MEAQKSWSGEVVIVNPFIMYLCRIADVILETSVVDWVRILYVELYLGISVESRVRRER